MTIAGEAYQVIGAVAFAAGLFDNSDVQRALDYFADPKGEILPFSVTPDQALVGALAHIEKRLKKPGAFRLDDQQCLETILGSLKATTASAVGNREAIEP